MSVPYTELHCHSAYSFLDGASLPEELAATALELGHRALALTDHDGVYGSMEFAHAARGLGLRPIHGAELSLADGRHLTLLVAVEQGWRNLCRLLTLAAERFGPPLGEQGALLDQAGVHRRARLREAIQQMRSAAGADAALRVHCLDLDSRVPERRVMLAPFES